MRTFWKLTRTEIALLLREPAVIVFTLALPLGLLVLNGSGPDANAPQPELGGVGVIDVLVPGYLLLVMCTSGIMSLPENLASYRERGFLRRLRLSPLRPWQIIGAHAATHFAISLLGLALLVTAGLAVFDLSQPAAWAPTVLAIVGSAAAVIAVGFLLAAVLPTTRTTQAVAAAIYFPAIFVSGAIIPVESLPDFAVRVGNVLPFRYGVDAIREAWNHGTVDTVAMAVLAATIVAGVAIGLRVFRWETRS